MNRYYKGVILILLSTVGYGAMPVFAQYAYRGGISVSTLLFIRFFLAAVFLFAYVFLKIRKISLTKANLVSLLVLGGVCYTLQSTFYFSAIKYIPSSLAALILYTYPALVCILSIYIVLGNHVVKTLQPLVTTSFISLFAAAGLLVLGLATRSMSFRFDSSVWMPAIGIVLFSTIIAVLAFLSGVKLLGSAKSSVISLMEPVFVIIFSTMLLGERLSLLQAVGAVIVIGGALSIMLVRESGKETEI